MKTKSSGHHITKIEITKDKINGRGGLTFILRYFEKVQIFKLIEITLGGFCTNKKGKSPGFILRQVMSKLCDGTDTAISGFDRLKQDESYGAVIETSKDELISSHSVKRFFRKFIGLKYIVLRNILTELFVWRLKIEQPSIVILDIDTMVLDNDDAKKRHGVDVTYKNKMGFQPLHISWRNKIVDALFRRGTAHSNHGNDVQKSVTKIVTTIRSRYRKDVPILLVSDSGFFDQKNFECFEKKLKIFYICTGKLYKGVKDHIETIGSDEFKEFSGKSNIWKYVEFGSKLDSWEKFRRAIFTSLVQDKGQMLLECVRPNTVIYTNIGMETEMTKQLIETKNEEYLNADKILELAHSRGVSELIHRSLKEFIGKEQLPFKCFGMNGAYYYIQLITHFLYECYKEDVSHDVVPLGSYPTTFRRKLIDFAAKITETGNRVILQVTNSIWNDNNISEIWKRCNNPIPLLL